MEGHLKVREKKSRSYKYHRLEYISRKLYYLIGSITFILAVILLILSIDTLPFDQILVSALMVYPK